MTLLFFSVLDTDSIYVSITAPPLQESGRALRNSDLLYEMRQFIDFGPFLPFPNHVIWTELRKKLGEEDFSQFYAWAKSRQGLHGLYKQETNIGSRNQEIVLFLPIRSKCYLCLVHLEDEDGKSTQWFKQCSKGPILKSRVNHYGIDDYVEMSQIAPPKLELDMRKIQSKCWKLYFTNISRRRPNVFERKRRLVDTKTGRTVPFGYQGP